MMTRKYRCAVYVHHWLSAAHEQPVIQAEILSRFAKARNPCIELHVQAINEKAALDVVMSLLKSLNPQLEGEPIGSD